MKRRRKVGGKKKLVLPFLVLVIILLIIAVIRFNVFSISSVEVSLDKINCASSDQIKNLAKLTGQNFFLINSSSLANKLKNNFVCVGQVQVLKTFPNKIKLNVSGRIPAAILMILNDQEASSSASFLEKFDQTESSSSAEASQSAVTNFMDANFRKDQGFVVDNEGVVYSNHIEQISAPIVYINGFNLSLGQKVSGNLINQTLKILQKVNSLGLEVGDAEIYSKVFLLVNSKPKMIFLLNNNIDDQIGSLQLIYDQAKIDHRTLEFIDLRFDKPVVKFAPKK